MRFLANHLRLSLVALIVAVLLLPIPREAAGSSVMEDVHHMAEHGQMVHVVSGPMKAAVDLCKQHCLAGVAILPGLSGAVAAHPVPDPVYAAEPVRPAFERPEPQGPPPKHALS
ncbi:MAG: hypothetical protein GC186_19860 [Rhodobacteraceae bacterium]|nr:hypothetical protein [Paracoccaceae bacterium]